MWNSGYFIKSGAKELDEELLNKPLKWLKGKKYNNVLIPFSKGLEFLLKAINDKRYLSDVITDMYEALEALSKIITQRPKKELSANAELFLKKIKASEGYKKILKEYITYAQNFRHALGEGSEKPSLSYYECESFVYLTGIFLRLAIESEK